MNTDQILKFLFMMCLAPMNVCITASEHTPPKMDLSAASSLTSNHTESPVVPFKLSGSIDLPISLETIHINLNLPMEAVLGLTGLIQISYGAKLIYNGIRNSLSSAKIAPDHDIEQGLMPQAHTPQSAPRSGPAFIAAGTLFTLCGVVTACAGKLIS